LLTDEDDISVWGMDASSFFTFRNSVNGDGDPAWTASALPSEVAFCCSSPSVLEALWAIWTSSVFCRKTNLSLRPNDLTLARTGVVGSRK
jgi:hypothetical protein